MHGNQLSGTRCTTRHDMIGKPKSLIVVGYGINCDRELGEAFRRAGADVYRAHLNELTGGMDIRAYPIIGLSGGFTFGDDTFAGNIFAKRIEYAERLREQLEKHLRDRKLIFGVCNGCQIGALMNLVPVFGNPFDEPEVALTYNDSARYEDRGNTHLKVVSHKSHWLNGLDVLRNIPVGHGEGKFYATQDVLKKLYEDGLVALKYVHEDGSPANGEYPLNPNGSSDDIAGIASEQVLLMMPHFERAIEPWNQDGWTRRRSILRRRGLSLPEEGDGMAVFRNGVRYAQTFL